MNYTTPMQKVNIGRNNIYIKRDDLVPFSLGGNKVRIAYEFVSDMKLHGKDCMIGYGNARSNLSRALANLCLAEGIPCCIISPSDDDGSRIQTANSKLVKVCEASVLDCAKDNVPEAVDHAVSIYVKKGLKPYYIYGNRYGKGNEVVPLKAYMKTYKEILRQADEYGISFDYIFLATGTGMTQSGLLLGKLLHGGREKIIGISIARDARIETTVIESNIRAYEKQSKIGLNLDGEIVVNDEYRFGGYGVRNETINCFILECFKKTGVPLDPNYTGKAFYGMLELLKKEKIDGKNVLFIHTGGIPLFFDFLSQYKGFRNDECSSKD